MGRNRLKSTMYRHTIGHQHQVLRKPAASSAQGDAFRLPSRPGLAVPSAFPLHHGQSPQQPPQPCSTPCPPHTRRHPHPPPPPRQNPTRGISVSGRGAQGQGREAAVSRHHHHHPPATPASTGPHAASHLASFPSPRVGETLPAAASPPDPAVNSGHRHPRTSRRATVTLPVPSVRRRRGSERGRGAGRAAGNPPGGIHA